MCSETCASPAVGLGSAEDADSEGEEGRFYVWREDELSELLSADELDCASTWYGGNHLRQF